MKWSTVQGITQDKTRGQRIGARVILNDFPVYASRHNVIHRNVVILHLAPRVVGDNVATLFQILAYLLNSALAIVFPLFNDTAGQK